MHIAWLLEIYDKLLSGRLFASNLNLLGLNNNNISNISNWFSRNLSPILSLSKYGRIQNNL